MIGALLFLSCDGELVLGVAYRSDRCARVWPASPDGVELAGEAKARDAIAPLARDSGWTVGAVHLGRPRDLCRVCAARLRLLRKPRGPAEFCIDCKCFHELKEPCPEPKHRA